VSKEAFVRFRETVVQSDDLRSQLVDTVKSPADLVAMGRKLGFEFDAADLMGGELTEDDLKLVAGGVLGADKDHKIESPIGLQGERWAVIGGFNELLHKVGVGFPK